MAKKRWEDEQPKVIGPPPEFVRWWCPLRTDEEHGGSIGGHDHCLKRLQSSTGVWGWSGGLTAKTAWRAQCYRDEFEDRTTPHAESTGLNYSNYGWHKPYPQPPNPACEARIEHEAWLQRHGKARSPKPLETPMKKAVAWMIPPDQPKQLTNGEPDEDEIRF